MADFLSTIAEKTKARVAVARMEKPVSALEKETLFARKPRDVCAAFRCPLPNIIAEIKFASPSEGVIHTPIEPVRIADGYLSGGARMLSVLTEEDYFKGSLSYLRQVRQAHPEALLLRKDFILDAYQLIEARSAGADCILLIVAMLDPSLFRDLLRAAKDLGLTALVETHCADELSFALGEGADFVGVNNRNLKTLKIDLQTSRDLISYKTGNTLFVCESGLKTARDIRDMHALGYDGFLIGSSLMHEKDPGVALGALQKELS